MGSCGWQVVTLGCVCGGSLRVENHAVESPRGDKGELRIAVAVEPMDVLNCTFVPTYR